MTDERVESAHAHCVRTGHTVRESPVAPWRCLNCSAGAETWNAIRARHARPAQPKETP